MFGKPEWFRAKTFGWGLVPITWQGWVYTAGWCAAIAAPMVLLLESYKATEAIIWVSFGIGALVYDVRQILRTMNGPSSGLASAVKKASHPTDDDGILYILDNGPTTSRLATRNYNLQLKQ